VLEFLGRIDNQVKVRGFRIELGEIEAALAAHPAVQAAAVAVRRAAADERLVAYVVERPGRDAGGAPAPAGALFAALREALAARLPAYMVPADYVRLDALPLNANGKVDRQALPEPPAAAGAEAGQVAPRTPVEKTLAALFGAVLAREAVGLRDSFFALGGHSLLALRLVARIRDTFGRDLPLASLLRAPTVERLATLLEEGAGPARRTPLVELTPAAPELEPARPFFCVHPAGGNVLCYADLARNLGTAQPCYGLQLPDLAALGPQPTIESLAALYVAALPPPPSREAGVAGEAGVGAGEAGVGAGVAEEAGVEKTGVARAAGPAGAAPRPYALGGWSLGGAIAFEMARQLRAAGQPVEPLILIDPAPVNRDAAAAPDEAQLKLEFLRDLCLLSGRGGAALADADPPLRRDPAFDSSLPLASLVAAAQRAALLPADLTAAEVEHLFALFRVTRQALHRYRPAAAPGPLTLLLASRRPAHHAGAHPATAWAALGGAGTEIQTLSGDHYSLVRPPAVRALAATIRRLLAP
jgi:thioesterase domain-containing protein/acyl carrier protein